jgi:2-polyprenyl-6-methoxyphenol hydroxylase-like FAD-dependent oxidoreductase
MRPLRIAVAGAGTAGLAAAAFLARAGHRVRLFERFDRPKPVGAGLLLQPTGSPVLPNWGSMRLPSAMANPSTRFTGRSARAGRIWTSATASLAQASLGSAFIAARCFSVLHAEVVRLGIGLTTATEIAASRATAEGRILVDRQNHEHGVVELLIDATGVRSPLRTDAASLRRERPYAHGAVWGSLLEPADWPLKDRLLQRYVRRQMACTLAGMKTGVFMHIDPGRWHPAYALPRLTTDTPPAAVPAAARDSAPALGRSEVGHDR